MQPPTVREIIRRLEKEGFVMVRQSGSHRRFVKGGRKVTVSGKLSDHPDRKTWKSICTQAGW